MTYCEFRGYGVQCTACESQTRKGCTFRGTSIDLERFFANVAPWLDTTHRGESCPSFSLIF